MRGAVKVSGKGLVDIDDFEKITINAMKSAFLPYKERYRIIYEVIKPGYQKIRSDLERL